MTPNPSTPRLRPATSSAAASQSARATSASTSASDASAVPSDRKGPVKRLRFGRISAAIWENGSAEKKFYSVTFARTYVDEAKNFHDSDSFGRDDLPLVEKLADRAHAYIFERLAGAKADSA